MRDALGVMKGIAQDQARLEEADVLSVDTQTRRARIRLRSSSHTVQVYLGTIDPDGVLDGRARLLVYVSPYGGIYPLSVIGGDKPVHSSKPGMTLGDSHGATRFVVRNADREEVFSVDSLGRLTWTGAYDNWTPADETGGGVDDADYVVLSLHPDLTSERVLTAGSGIDISDAGPGGNVTVAHETGDFGDVHTNYAEGDQDEEITGVWDFENGLTIGNDTKLYRYGANILALLDGDSLSVVGGIRIGSNGIPTTDLDVDGSADISTSVAIGVDLAVDGDTLFADGSEDAVYVNAGTLPTYRGALTVHPANTTQHGFVLQSIAGHGSAGACLLKILDSSGTDLIILDSDGNLESGSPAFVSGQAGWQLSHLGDAEFNNIWARGALHASVFAIGEVHIDGGTILVAEGSKLSAGFTTPGALNGTVTITIDDPPTGAAQLFDTGHNIRIKAWTGTALVDIWGPLTAYATNGDGTQSYTLTLKSGSTSTYIPAGTAVASYGSATSGRILLTSDMNYGPYMDVFTSGATPWVSTVPHVRVGNLEGVPWAGAGEWGIAVSADLSAVSSNNYVILSNEQLTIKGASQYWVDSSGNVRGQVNPAAAAGDILFWLGLSEAGAGLKVYGNGTLWLNSLLVSESLGQFLFSQADGLLLLGPHAAITPTSWTSTRGHVATISGAFHQEQGRWAGTRGLVIEPAITNNVLNPSIETNTTGYTAYSGASISRSGDAAMFGEYSLAVATGTSVYGGVDYLVAGILSASTAYVASFFVKGLAAHAIYFEVRNHDNSGTLATINTVATGGWQRVSLPFITAAGQTNLRLRWIKTNDATDYTFYLDGIQVEYGTLLTSYTDGDRGTGYGWNGTPHESRSYRLVTAVNLDAHAGMLSGRATWSIATWVQVPYAAPAPWATVPVVWDVYGTTNERVFVAFDPATNAWRVSINGNYRIYSAVQSFAAGDWIHLVLTCDFTADSYSLYVNGALAGNTTTALTAPTLTTWRLGSAYNNTGQGGYTIGEYATFGRVLTADEIAAMYATSKPLVDAGSTSKPGIYIYDGQFAIASSTSGSRLVLSSSSLSIGTDMTFLTGTGVWLGLDSGTPKMRIGYASGHSIVWNGSTLAVYGNLTSYSGIIGGWNMTSNALYKLSSGTPTSTPNTGITLEMEGGYNSLPIARVYNGTTLVAALGSYSSSVQGIWARSGQIGGWSLTTTAIEKTGHAGIDSTNNLEKFWVRSSTWDTLGVQIEYNSGSPRMHVGAPSADRTNHLMYSSAGLEIVTFGGALRFNAVGFQFGLAEAASGGRTGAGVVWKNDLSSGANHNVTFGYIRMTTGVDTSDMEFVSGDRTAGVGGDNQYWRDMLFRNEAYIGAAGYTRTWLTQEASNRRLLFYGATNDATYSFTNPGDNRVAMWVKQDNAAGTGAVLRIEQNLSRESYYIVFDGAYLDFSDGGTHKGRAIKVGVTTGGSWAGSGWLYVFDSATPPFAWA